MDLREDVVNFIDKLNLDDFTKIRYIYLYVCNKFSYDVRFSYADNKLKEEIASKIVDVSNIQEYELVCYAYCKILCDLLSMYGINCEIVRENTEADYRHAYVIVMHQGKVLRLDPTKKHDTTRVKMKNGTIDFESLIDDPVFSDQLQEADQQIESYENNNIDSFVAYNSVAIAKKVHDIEQYCYSNNMNHIELFFKKLDTVFSIINNETKFDRYDDMDYYLSYLLIKFGINSNKHYYAKPAIFFKIDDHQMKDIINIILVEYPNLPTVFYLMKKEEDGYKIHEVDKDTLLNLLDEYSNWKVDYYYREKLKGTK